MTKSNEINPRFFLAAWAFLIAGWGCLLVAVVRGVSLNTIHEIPIELLKVAMGASCTICLWEELWFFIDLGKQTWILINYENEVPPAISNRGVYLIKSSASHYKIGQSSNVRGRLRELQGASPLRLSIECVLPCTDLKAGEAYLHGLFEARRNHGEWFDLTPMDISVIKGIQTL